MTINGDGEMRAEVERSPATRPNPGAEGVNGAKSQVFVL